jgi:GT2 family glycosyltransferase
MLSYDNSQPGRTASLNTWSASTMRQWASRYLPARVKRSLKTGFPGAAVSALLRLRAYWVTRSLSSDRVFVQNADDSAAGASMSIIVPVHDAPQVTRRCLASLERYAAEAEIILVDDASRLRETTTMIRKYRDRNGWKLISNLEAGGHSAACRDASLLATRPYLCLLNSDTVVTPSCWRWIQEAFDTDSNIAVAGPGTSRSATRQCISVARDCRFDWNDSQICAFAERLAGAALKSSIIDLPWIGGFALFIRRDVWHELGGFDQNLADYANEMELCKRVTAAGHRAVWAKRGYIHHFGAQSYGQVLGQDELLRRKVEGSQYVRSKHS